MPLSLVLVLALATPFRVSAAASGGDVLDASWQWALYHALLDRLGFGRAFLFTYGPLGFLDARTIVSGRALVALSMVVALVARTALLDAVLWRAMRWVKEAGTRGAASGGLFLLALCASVTVEALQMETSFVLAALALLLSLEALGAGSEGSGGLIGPLLPPVSGDREGTWRAAARLAGAGFVLGVAGLVKSSLVVLAVPMLAIAAGAVLADPRRSLRSRVPLAAAPLAIWALTVAGLWVLCGQAVGDLPHFLLGTEAIVVGYGDAMSVPGVPIRVAMVIALAGLVCIALAVVLFDTGREGARSRPISARAAPAALAGVFAFLWWKEGVVRDDVTLVGGHLDAAFVGLGFAAVALLLGVPRLARSGVVRFSVVAMLPLVLIGGLLGIAQASLSVRLSSTAGMVAALASAPRYDAARARTLAGLRRELGLPASMVREIGRRRVLVLPSSLLAGPAYGLDEALLPVPQLYSAYLPELDRVDAAVLSGAPTPFVLLRWQAIDGEYPQWQAPATLNEVLEDSEKVASGRGWLLLRYRPTPVRDRVVGSVVLPDERWAAIPACRAGIEALRTSFHLSPFAQARSFLYQLPAVYLELRERSGSTRTYRLPWADAPDGLDVGKVVTSGAGLPGSLFASTAPAGSQVTAIRLLAPGWMFTSSGGTVATGTLTCMEPARRAG